jgi:hypothetical protein
MESKVSSRIGTKWWNRNDLFDYVVTTKDPAFIARFINQIREATQPILAALFLKRPDMADQVLGQIQKDVDDTLAFLTSVRPELAESHENFFKGIDKIKNPKYQEWAVDEGVRALFNAKKHDSVIPLIDALEKRTFIGRKLNDIAIRKAFDEGAHRRIKDIVEKLHDHPAITPKVYVDRLMRSWDLWGKSDPTVSFLLDHADQGDLDEAKKRDKYKNGNGRFLEFREAIDDAIPKAESAGSRHDRFFNREIAKVAKKTFSEIPEIEPLSHETEIGGIISGYL